MPAFLGVNMRNKKVKGIRAQFKDNPKYVGYTYVVAPAYIKAVKQVGGLEKYQEIMGYAPVNVLLENDCVKKLVKDAKRNG